MQDYHQPEDNSEDEAEQPESVVEAIRIQQRYTECLKTAQLEDSPLSSDIIETLRNPPRTTLDNEIENTPNLALCLDLFVALESYADQAYTNVRNVIEKHFPDRDKLFSHYQMKNRIEWLSGVVSMATDMCPNSCMAYTGPLADRTTCLYCDAARYKPETETADCDSEAENHPDKVGHVPVQQFFTVPIGPQLQALWRHPRSAKLMKYRTLRTLQVQQEINASPDGQTQSYDDIFCGSEYLQAVADGKIGGDDIYLIWSCDGAQLYRNVESDCWIFIWIIADKPPGVRYRKGHVLYGASVPGPNPPKLLISFAFPGLHHLAALQNEGLQIWDGLNKRLFTSIPFLGFVTGDQNAIAPLQGWVGHKGKHGCRVMCGHPSRRVPGTGHYYPALLKPDGYGESGCDHDDISLDSVPSPSTHLYRQHLEYVLHAPNVTEFKRRRLETGINGVSIFDGVPHKTDIPTLFTADLMHLTALNFAELISNLLRGTLKRADSDPLSSWTWAVLRDQTWIDHGQAVADAKRYLPGTLFDRVPRDPAKKVSSGYKAKEFQIWIYVLCPGLLYGVLPDNHWQHFCKIAAALRSLHKDHISVDSLIKAHQLILEFHMEFEEVYYQRKVSRLHFVCPSLHGMDHLAPEIVRVGSLSALAQWTMERTIGNLGQELRLPSNPYANLSQRGVKRAQLNTLRSIKPDLGVSPKPKANQKFYVNVGAGYVLRHPRDTTPCIVPNSEAGAIQDFAASMGIDNAHINSESISVRRWARLQLPDKHVARSVWKERPERCSNPQKTRISRNVKVSRNVYS